MRGDGRRQGFAGANVTVPHKGAALALADDPSETAREIGAANTLSFADGEIRADNTDARRPARRAAAIRQTGAGHWSSGRAAPPAPSVWALVARGGRGRGLEPHRAARAANLCAELGGHAGRASPNQAEYELIINSTAVGLHGEDPFEELPLRADWLRRRADRRRHGLRRASRPRCWRCRRGAERPSSTESRSSSARAPSRCGSGPAASRRSTSMRAAARAWHRLSSCTPHRVRTRQRRAA